MGRIDARGGPPPANIEALFPDPFNADTWNLAAISPAGADLRHRHRGLHDARYPARSSAAWLQDDWQISSNLTLNLGVRYDLSVNANGNEYAVPPFIEAGRPNDKNNIQPRVGFAYQLNDRTVLRGGTGLYFADAAVRRDLLHGADRPAAWSIQITNDGRPNFAADPLNGQPLPTLAQAASAVLPRHEMCPAVSAGRIQELMAPGRLHDEIWRAPGRPRSASSGRSAPPWRFEADYVYSQGRHEKDVIDNVNLTFNPATGANYPFSDISRRAYPDYGLISLIARTGRSSYHALQTGVTKRLSNRWQGVSDLYAVGSVGRGSAAASAGCIRSRSRPRPIWAVNVTFDASDMRHRAMFNGIWQVGHGFQVSGLFYLGVGERAATNYGGVRDFAASAAERRAPGCARTAPSFRATPSRSPPASGWTCGSSSGFRLSHRASIDAIAEVFNAVQLAQLDDHDPGEQSAVRARRRRPRTAPRRSGFRLTF